MESYVRALQERGDYGRFFADRIQFSIAGTDQAASGAEGTEQMIRFMHEVAFDAQPEIVNLVCGDRGAAIEAVFVGTHIGEFAGVPASGNAVRQPYSVLYDVGDDGITALRIYMSVEALIGQISVPATVG
jgi:predicted ester cyclase